MGCYKHSLSLDAINQGRVHSYLKCSTICGGSRFCLKNFLNMQGKASTQSKHEALATKYGVYYSCLLQLEYFDAVRFAVIDPMHNVSGHGKACV